MAAALVERTGHFDKLSDRFDLGLWNFPEEGVFGGEPFIL
jgi:hypothetical protein